MKKLNTWSFKVNYLMKIPLNNVLRHFYVKNSFEYQQRLYSNICHIYVCQDCILKLIFYCPLLSYGVLWSLKMPKSSLWTIFLNLINFIVFISPVWFCSNVVACAMIMNIFVTLTRIFEFIVYLNIYCLVIIIWIFPAPLCFRTKILYLHKLYLLFYCSLIVSIKS